MSWWHFRHPDRERQSAPDTFERFYDRSCCIESIVSALASANELVRFNNLKRALSRPCHLRFAVIDVQYSVEVVERGDCVIVLIRAPNEGFIDSDGSDLMCLVEARLERYMTMPPPSHVDEYDEIEDLMRPPMANPLELVMISIDLFQDYAPPSITVDLLRDKFLFPGVEYYNGAVRLHLDEKMINPLRLPWFGWGGGGALEQGVYLVRWLKYPYNGGQQLIGGYTDCILARIPTPLSEAGLKRSPYVWGEVQLHQEKSGALETL